MNHSQFFKTCLIFLFIAACDTQGQTTPVKKNTEKKSTPQKHRPVLDLSIDNITLDYQEYNDANFLNDKEYTQQHSDLFRILSQDTPESGINISGTVLTDDEKLENWEFLESIEGVQINIEGKFE